MSPLIIAVVCAVIMMFSALFTSQKQTASVLAKVLILVLIAANVYELCALTELSTGVTTFFDGQLQYDAFSIWLNIILTIGTFLYFLLSSKHIEQVGLHVAEYYSLLFFILAGINLLSGFGSLLILFLGIELISIPQYILAGSDKKSLKSSESALKYFLMGAFSTGIMLMGIVLLFGSTGSFMIADFNFSADATFNMMSIMGILLITIALGFKVSAAPMHFWTPDVYDGAPTPFTSFMATIGKAGIFVGFIKLFHSSISNLNEVWSIFLALIILVTLIIGNITAVYQQSVKRMLAYSSIAQAGFMLFAVLAVNASGMKGIIIYSFAYCIATIAIFSVLMKMKDYTYDGFNGLAKREPFVALVLSICLFSLAGIPLTAGFFAKFYVLRAALEQYPNMLWLIIVALVLAAVSAYYYFKLIIAMYFKKGDAEMVMPVSTWDKVLLSIAAASLIIVGIVPDVLLWM